MLKYKYSVIQCIQILSRFWDTTYSMLYQGIPFFIASSVFTPSIIFWEFSFLLSFPFIFSPKAEIIWTTPCQQHCLFHSAHITVCSSWLAELLMVLFAPNNILHIVMKYYFYIFYILCSEHKNLNAAQLCYSLINSFHSRIWISGHSRLLFQLKYPRHAHYDMTFISVLKYYVFIFYWFWHGLCLIRNLGTCMHLFNFN